jgi:hypothetical protein
MDNEAPSKSWSRRIDLIVVSDDELADRQAVQNVLDHRDLDADHALLSPERIARYAREKDLSPDMAAACLIAQLALRKIAETPSLTPITGALIVCLDKARAEVVTF